MSAAVRLSLQRIACFAAVLLATAGHVDAQFLGKCDPNMVWADGTIDTFAGSGPASFAGGGFAGDGDLGTNALLKFPGGLASDGSYLYIADTGNHRIRRLNLTTCVIDTVAGRGLAAPPTLLWAGDGGPATSAYLNAPRGVAVAESYLYVSDTNNHRIRRVDLVTGLISKIAGLDYEFTYNGDGIPATTAAVHAPWQLAVADGMLYVAERGNNRVRRIDLATGFIDTVAGNGEPGFSGDGGLATEARLNFPSGVAVAGGVLWISDAQNARLRRVDLASGVITTAAGVLSPDQLTASANALYVAVQGWQGVTKLNLTTGIIKTIAGTFSEGFSGDMGPGEFATLRNPAGLVVVGDALFIADMFNQRVRRLQLSPGRRLASLTGADLWIGLVNSDDVGTNFDLRVEVLKNGGVVASGETRNIRDVQRNPAKAKAVSVAFGPISDPEFEDGDVLSLRVLSRVTAAGGHASAVGLRLYYDGTPRMSKFGAEIAPSPLMNFFLHSGNFAGHVFYFANAAPPVAATAQFKDSAAIKRTLFKEIATWTLRVQD